MGISAEGHEPDEILQHLKSNKQKVFLLGKSGVGKTWMAREVCRRARQQGFSCGTLWFAPDDNISGQRVSGRIAENVALQLSVYSFNEDSEDDEDDSEMWEQEGLDEDDLKQKIREKLEAMKSSVKITSRKDGKPDESSSAIPEPKETPKSNKSDSVAPQEKEEMYILVVLDGFALEQQKKMLEELNKILLFPKYLITGTDGKESPEKTGPEIHQEEENCHIHHMRGLSVQDSLDLLRKRVKGHVRAASNFEKLCSEISNTGPGLADGRSLQEPGFKIDLLVPSLMLMLAEALNNAQRQTLGLSHDEHAGEWTLESALEEAAGIVRSGDFYKLVPLVYEMLPRNETVTQCSWHSRHLFVNQRAMHCNELTVHWLLEGYFGDFEQIETAFEEGHHTLMDLKDRGILKERENSFIYLEMAEAKLHDHRRGAFHATTRLGLADVMADAEAWAGLGRTTLADGVMKTSHKKKDEISTLLIDGLSHLWRKFPGTYLSSMRKLRNLVIINPTFRELPPSLLSLKEIQVLVLRGCGALVSVDNLDELEKLLVLEISGASKLATMKSDLFGKMQKVRSVNLSGAGIKAVPSTLMKLKELRWLILRDCKMLEVLFSLKDLVQLEVLDLSGSSNFRKLNDKNLSTLKELQTLDLSRTSVDRLPFFGELTKLSRLLLGECPNLDRLPTLQKLNALEILDVSGAKALKVLVQDDSLMNKPHLRVLDISRSVVTSVPENVGDLTHFLLRGCTGLTSLSSIKNMGKLQVLDLSGASSLCEIEDFKETRELRDLILSGTKLKVVPKFSNGWKLRRLVLKDCAFLTELPNFELLESLEVLDLSGCRSLKIEGLSFRDMSSLKILDLSGTKLQSLASDCFPTSLSQLIIRDCAELKELPAMGSLKALEKLDLFGSKSLGNLTTEIFKQMTNLRVLNLSDVPLKGSLPLSQMTKLRELSLAGCSFEVETLVNLKELRLLDLSRTKRVSLPSLESFPKLRHLLLRDCSELKELVNLKALKNLEVLDIAGTTFALPQDIASLPGLKKLHLQEIKHGDWSKIKIVPEYISWQKCDPASSLDDMTSLVIGGMSFFRLMMDSAGLWDSHFKKFHFSVWIPKEEATRRSHDDVRHTSILERNTGFLKDVISVGRIPTGGEYSRCLEIHGLLLPEPETRPVLEDAMPGSDTDEVHNSAPKPAEPEYNHIEALKDALIHAEHISLIDSSSIENISQIGGENLEAMKSLWLENCANITRIFNRIEDVRLGQKLRSLCLWNLPSLTCMYDDALDSKPFPNLKTLHVECCPLPKIFHLSWVPENLETLRLKFCKDVTEIFDCSSKSGEFKYKLRKLHLVGLPKLIRIGLSMPRLKELKLRGCQGVEDLGEVLENLEYLEILHISDAARLKSFSANLQNLLDLKIESCPQLEYIFSWDFAPQKLVSLEIKHCEKLVSLFDSATTRSVLLRSLTSLLLWKLPVLEYINTKLPSECSFRYLDCPKLPIDLYRYIWSL